jgi:hypothetical protein
MSIMVESFLSLSRHCHVNPANWNNLQNQIYLGGINNDNINQSVNAINQ